MASFSRRPISVTCYICGRGYGTVSATCIAGVVEPLTREFTFGFLRCRLRWQSMCPNASLNLSPSRRSFPSTLDDL